MSTPSTLISSTTANSSRPLRRSSNDSILSSALSSDHSSDDLVVTPEAPAPSRSPVPPLQPVPRTPNRTVRFALDETPGDDQDEETGDRWTAEEDYLHSDDEDEGLLGRRPTSQFEFGELLENARPKSGMKMAFMNMANSIIGAGIIGQPYAFRQAGLGMGIFLLVGLTITVDWTINLIVINSKLSGTKSFQATVSACFGRPGLIAISVAQWAFAFGGMIAFCIIVGDTIPHVIYALFPSADSNAILSIFTNRRACIAIFILTISYPLSWYRDIAKLAKASTLALISMLIIVLTVITQGFTVPEDMKGKLGKDMLLLNDGVFQAIGVISFAFVCHHNSLLIYGSLKTPTLDRFAQVTHYSTGISMIACLLMAVCGFLTFGDKTEGNVLNNFPSNNVMVNIARFCFGLNMLTTLPLEAFVCREVVETYFFPDAPFSMKRHLIFGTSHVVSAMVLSLLTCDLGVVFELIGATSACALAYILPPLCYMKLATRSWKTYVAGATVAFGVCVMVISVVQSFLKILRGGAEGGTC